MPGKWSAAQRAKFTATMAAKRERGEWPARRTPRRRTIDFPRCGTLLPTGRPCRMPASHGPDVLHRERLKGEYARAVVRSMTGIDLADPSYEPVVEGQNYSPARGSPQNGADSELVHERSLDALEASLEDSGVSAVDDERYDGISSKLDELSTAVRTLSDGVDALRWTVLGIHDGVELLKKGSGITPMVWAPPRDPELVEAIRTLHRRLQLLERRQVATGDWEEGLDEILQLARTMSRTLTRMAPEPRRKKAAS